MSAKYPLFSEDDDGGDLYDDRLYKFGTPIDNAELTESYNQKPLISYRYIDIELTDYCFDQTCIDVEDLLQYMHLLKKFSNTTINDLIDNAHHSTHFHIYPDLKRNQKLKGLVEQIADVQFTAETSPVLGQFALYTSKEAASRKENIKSPRIYFIIGQNGVIYILFYDPYHEINPGIKKS